MTDREKIEAYERVRSSGDFNMLMQQHEAADEAGLTLEEYRDVMKRYSELLDKYPNVRIVGQ